VSKPFGEIAYPTRIQALVAVVDLRRNGDVAFGNRRLQANPKGSLLSRLVAVLLGSLL
jgi:hypothetical protein